jgi:hypothetical protein
VSRRFGDDQALPTLSFEWVKNEIAVRLIDTFHTLRLDVPDEIQDTIANDAAEAAISAIRCQLEKGTTKL